MSTKIVAILSFMLMSLYNVKAGADGFEILEGGDSYRKEYVELSYDSSSFENVLSDAYSENFSASLNFYGAEDSSFETTRFEAQMSYQELFSNSIDGDFSKSVMMANIYKDFGRYEKISPYLGVGTGISYLQIEGDAHSANVESESEALASYQMMAGFAYKLSNDGHDSLHLGYRYSSNFGDKTLESNVNRYDDEMHSLLASVNFSF